MPTDERIELVLIKINNNYLYRYDSFETWF